MTRDKNLKLSAATSNGTLTIPAGYALESIIVENTTANAITGGIKIGTSSGGTQVVTAQAVAGSALLKVAAADISLGVFSTSADQILYIQAVTSWNSASINVWMTIRRLNP